MGTHELGGKILLYHRCYTVKIACFFVFFLVGALHIRITCELILVQVLAKGVKSEMPFNFGVLTRSIMME